MLCSGCNGLVNNSHEEGNMAGRFWNVMLCSLVIFRVPQPEYPDDIGGRFLQNVGTYQSTAFVMTFLKTPSPRNLLNFFWGVGGDVACTYKWMSWDRSLGSFWVVRTVLGEVSAPQQFCPVSISWCRGAQIPGARTPLEAEFCTVVPKMCRLAVMKSVQFHRCGAKNFEVAPKSL